MPSTQPIIPDYLSNTPHHRAQVLHHPGRVGDTRLQSLLVLHDPEETLLYIIQEKVTVQSPESTVSRKAHYFRIIPQVNHLCFRMPSHKTMLVP